MSQRPRGEHTQQLALPHTTTYCNALQHTATDLAANVKRSKVRPEEFVGRADEHVATYCLIDSVDESCHIREWAVSHVH